MSASRPFWCDGVAEPAVVAAEPSAVRARQVHDPDALGAVALAAVLVDHRDDRADQPVGAPAAPLAVRDLVVDRVPGEEVLAELGQLDAVLEPPLRAPAGRAPASRASRSRRSPAGRAGRPRRRRRDRVSAGGGCRWSGVGAGGAGCEPGPARRRPRRRPAAPRVRARRSASLHCDRPPGCGLNVETVGTIGGIRSGRACDVTCAGFGSRRVTSDRRGATSRSRAGAPAACSCTESRAAARPTLAA